VGERVDFVLDTQAIHPGDNLTASIGNLIEHSDGMLAILPKRGNSSWFSAEIAIALAKASKESSFSLIPIVIHPADIPYMMRDRLYVSFSDPNSFSPNVRMIAEALLSDRSQPDFNPADVDAIRKASIDAKRALLEINKAQHERQRVSEYRVVGLAVVASVISVIATAVPWIFSAKLTYTQLGSSLIGFLMLFVGFAFGRLSAHRKSHSKSSSAGSEQQ